MPREAAQVKGIAMPRAQPRRETGLLVRWLWRASHRESCSHRYRRSRFPTLEARRKALGYCAYWKGSCARFRFANT